AFGPRGDARPVHLVRPNAFAVVRGYEPALLPAFFLFRPDRRVRLGGRVGGAGLSGGRELAPDRGRARRGERPGGGGDRGGLRPGRDPAAAGPVGAGVRACAMLRVGLTGNIASGKSTVSRVWARLGAHVIDADELARRAVEPGSPGLARLVEEFGPGILDDDGRLDRGAMRRLVFRDPEARRRLEAVVHPEVARLRAEAEAALAEAGVDVVVNEIPLLVEVGLESSFDIVVLVEADVATRLERLMRTRGLDRAEALR